MSSPMKVVKPVVDTPGGSCRTIALCKQSLLSTYEYANEYVSSSKEECRLSSIDQAKCKFPSVIIAPISQEYVDFEMLYSELQITLKRLEISTGLPKSHVPAPLLVSQHFMQAYGFYKEEPIWFRYVSTVPLDRVIISPCAQSENVAEKFAEEVVKQIYERCESEPLIMQQDFEYVFRVKLPPEASSSRSTMVVTPSKSSSNSELTQDHVLSFNVLEASPVLQGVITPTTVIILVPPSKGEEQLVQDESRPRCRSTSRSTMEGSFVRLRSESAASASDFQFEDQVGSVYQSTNDSGEYIIDVVAVENYKLQSHYIVLPKTSAASHGIFSCQIVWVCAIDTDSRGTMLEDLTLSLCNEQGQEGSENSSRMHVAVAFMYEDEFELEKYIPPSRLGAEYETVDLTQAYIHPELLFHICPETLSYSRKYKLQIKVG